VVCWFEPSPPKKRGNVGIKDNRVLQPHDCASRLAAKSRSQVSNSRSDFQGPPSPSSAMRCSVRGFPRCASAAESRRRRSRSFGRRSGWSRGAGCAIGRSPFVCGQPCKSRTKTTPGTTGALQTSLTSRPPHPSLGGTTGGFQAFQTQPASCGRAGRREFAGAASGSMAAC
jgi:hypothetical protein